MESKSPKVWAIVTILVAVIGCTGSIVAAILGAPWITQVLFTPTSMPNISTLVAGTQTVLALTSVPSQATALAGQFTLSPPPVTTTDSNLFATTSPLSPSPVASVPVHVISSTPTPSGGSDVWHARFYDNMDFEEPAVYERDDAVISFDWGGANPAPNVPKDRFGIHWSKCANFEERYYTFTTDTSDNLIVNVDGNTIVSEQYGGSHTVDYYVSAGQHCIDVYYSDYDGSASVYLDYKPGFQPTPSAGDNLWHAKFYDNMDFKEPAVWERDDAIISFDWGIANPAPNVPLDRFSIHWSKCANFEERYYTFTTDTSDNLIVNVDGNTVVSEQYGGSHTVDYYVSAGQHCIDVYYSDYDGSASVYVDYK